MNCPPPSVGDNDRDGVGPDDDPVSATGESCPAPHLLLNREQGVKGHVIQIRDCISSNVISNWKPQEPKRDCLPNCLAQENDTTQCLVNKNCPPLSGVIAVGTGVEPDNICPPPNADVDVMTVFPAGIPESARVELIRMRRRRTSDELRKIMCNIISMSKFTTEF